MSTHICTPAERELAVGLLLERRSDEGHRRLASLLLTLNPTYAPPRARHLEPLSQRLRLLAPQPHQIQAGSFLIRDLGGSSSIRVVRSCCIRQHTSAYVSIRSHTRFTPSFLCGGSSIRVARSCCGGVVGGVSVRQRTSAYVSIRQHYVSIR